jgi:hypothetical protein
MKIRLYTIISLVITFSAILFLEFWCPWMIVTPNPFIFIAYGLIAFATFLDTNPKERIWIYSAALSVSFLRIVIFLSHPDTFSIPSVYWNCYEFVVRYVEPVVVMLIGLFCFAVALRRRLIKTA